MLTSNDIIEIFKEISIEMQINKDYLIKLDAATGDGDLGITMSEGFSRICVDIAAMKSEYPGTVILNAGMSLMEAVPSTMGTLLAAALMRAGSELQECAKLTLSDVVKAWKSALTEIMKRGKAKTGEKTILDALVPAVCALEAVSSKRGSMKSAFEEAYKAAIKGRDATASMIPLHGRSAWYNEKALGKIDPGAAACVLIFGGILNWFENCQGREGDDIEENNE